MVCVMEVSWCVTEPLDRRGERALDLVCVVEVSRCVTEPLDRRGERALDLRARARRRR